jgi:conjugal transfer mating pair stabilization protein TraG
MGIQCMSNAIAGCIASAGFQDAGGNSGSLPTFCTTMDGTLAHQQASNAGGASMFEATVIPMMSVLQFLFFALSPLINAT